MKSSKKGLAGLALAELMLYPCSCSVPTCKKKIWIRGNISKECGKRDGKKCDQTGKMKKRNDVKNPINNPVAGSEAMKGKNKKYAKNKAKNNAKNNPKNNALVQERARKDNLARIEAMDSNEKPFKGLAAFNTARMILDHPLIDGERTMTVEEYLRGEVSFYVGYTGQMIEQECLRWLTERGNPSKKDRKKRNRPTLRHCPTREQEELGLLGKVITMKEAVEEVGFKVREVYSSTLMYNARAVEAALQFLLDDLELGHKLWRKADKGKKYDQTAPLTDEKVHKVFITHSQMVPILIESGVIVVNY